MQTKYENATLDKYKIPFVTNVVWVTNPLKPLELVDYEDEEVLNQLLHNYEVFDSTGVKWTHYLWTNYKELLPKTVQFFEEKGV